MTATEAVRGVPVECSDGGGGGGGGGGGSSGSGGGDGDGQNENIATTPKKENKSSN